MISEPLPHEGWSREIVTLRKAFVCPPVDSSDVFGVFSDDGDCAHAATWRIGRRMSRPVPSAPDQYATVPGRHLWGGTFYGHFGHFLVETTSRLWAAKGSGAESILFVPRHNVLHDQPYQRRMLELLDLGIPARLVRESTLVDELVIPGQGFGLGQISKGTPEFLEMIRHMADRIIPDGSERIYVSRTKFGGNGGAIAESVIERNLERHGYTAIHPEKMSLDDQFRAFKAAKKIIGLDSSAFHVFGFVSRPDQDAAIIMRRSNDAFRYIADQLEGSMARYPLVIDAITADWMKGGQKIPNHVSWGEIDHAQLTRELATFGFIGSDDDWIEPDAADIEASISWATRRTGAELVRRPVRKATEEAFQ